MFQNPTNFPVLNSLFVFNLKQYFSHLESVWSLNQNPNEQDSLYLYKPAVGPNRIF